MAMPLLRQKEQHQPVDALDAAPLSARSRRCGDCARTSVLPRSSARPMAPAMMASSTMANSPTSESTGRPVGRTLQHAGLRKEQEVTNESTVKTSHCTQTCDWSPSRLQRPIEERRERRRRSSRTRRATPVQAPPGQAPTPATATRPCAGRLSKASREDYTRSCDRDPASPGSLTERAGSCLLHCEPHAKDSGHERRRHSQRGIHALAAGLARSGEVTSSRRMAEASAIGHALTLRRPLRIEEVSPRVYSVDGTPTDCVNIALTTVLKEPARPGRLGHQQGVQPGRRRHLLGHRGRGARSGAAWHSGGGGVAAGRRAGDDFGPAAAGAVAMSRRRCCASR